MRRLFLDDNRNPSQCAHYMHLRGINVSIYSEDWFIVRSYTEFKKWITKNGLPDYISFDHDLGDIAGFLVNRNAKEYTGYDCAKWLVDYCIHYKLNLPEYTVHSANPVGTINIESYLANFKKHYQF